MFKSVTRWVKKNVVDPLRVHYGFKEQATVTPSPTVIQAGLDPNILLVMGGSIFALWMITRK